MASTSEDRTDQSLQDLLSKLVPETITIKDLNNIIYTLPKELSARKSILIARKIAGTIRMLEMKIGENGLSNILKGDVSAIGNAILAIQEIEGGLESLASVIGIAIDKPESEILETFSLAEIVSGALPFFIREVKTVINRFNQMIKT